MELHEIIALLLVLLANPSQVAAAPTSSISSTATETSKNSATCTSFPGAYICLRPDWSKVVPGLWPPNNSISKLGEPQCHPKTSMTMTTTTTSTAVSTTATAPSHQHTREIDPRRFVDYILPTRDYRWTVPFDQPIDLLRPLFPTGRPGSMVTRYTTPKAVTVTETVMEPTGFVDDLLVTIV